MTNARLLLLCAVPLSVAACSGGEEGVDGGPSPTPDAGVFPPVTALSVTPAQVSVGVGRSAQLTAIGTLDDGTTADVTARARYETSDNEVALVDQTGRVFGGSVGMATITVTLDGAQDTVTASVTEGGVVNPGGLPFVVDDGFPGRAGFGENGPEVHDGDNVCPTRAGSEAGLCHHFTWDGNGGAFTGLFWINGDGFENAQGVDVPEGATEVSFWAWGAAGGEVVTFGAGLGGPDADGAEARRLITLTTTPTQYSVSLAALGDYGPVFGGFVWAADTAGNPGGMEFYVDDIQWIEGEPAGAIPLPMTVDEHYMGRSSFGPNGPPLHTEDDMCPMRAGGEAGACHRFDWDGTGGGFTGSVWTVGDGFMDLEGKEVEAGATEVRFFAWCADDGEVVEFGAGIDEPGRDSGQIRTNITLSTTPTEYAVSLAALGEYGPVFGAFVFAATAEANPDGVTCYVDDIQWVRGEAPTEIALPMTVDEHYEGRSGFGPMGPPLHTEDAMCPTRAGGEAGACHRFVWNGTGGGFTGTFWTDGDGFANLNGKDVEAGATQVRFWAWGATGGETIEFGAGIQANDGAEARRTITLTTTPTEYTVSLAALGEYGPVFGPFVWAASAKNNPGGVTFYVDDIQWVAGTPVMSIPLPMTVDAHYEGRSGFGPSGPPLHTEDSMCPRRGGAAAGECHRFMWSGTGGAFTGTFWTDGESFMDLVGNDVAPGATDVRFYAWGASGGEVVEFGAGIGDANRDGAEARAMFTLTSTPTEYRVSLAPLSGYTEVYGPFVWAASVANNPGGLTFYVDDVQWVSGN